MSNTAFRAALIRKIEKERVRAISGDVYDVYANGQEDAFDYVLWLIGDAEDL